MGLAIQAISGNNYYDFIRDNILKPAQMTHTQPQRTATSTAVPYMSVPTFPVDVMPEWLKKLTLDESDHELNVIAMNAFKLFEIVQKFVVENPGYNYVRDLHVEYQNRLKTVDEKGYPALQTEFAEKLDKAYSMMCTLDKQGHFKFIHTELSQRLIENDQRLSKWLEKNPSKIQNVKELDILMGPDGLPSRLFWPMQVLGGIQINLSIGHPAGCWFSTVDDLLNFHQALWSKEGALNRYAQVLEAPTEAKEFGYGYGLGLNGKGGKSHSGGAPGVRTQAYTATQEGVTLIILGNDDNPHKSRLHRELEHFFVYGPVRYLDPSITPEKTFLDDIVAIHQNKNPERPLRAV